MADIPIAWEKITCRLPKTKICADDKGLTIEKIQKLKNPSDRRIKAIVYAMASPGIRLVGVGLSQMGSQ